MKKKLFALSLILLLLIVSCKQKESEISKVKESEVEETPKTKIEEPIKKTLGELQVLACNAADKAQTCNSRLPEVGIVEKEECCNILGKCC